MSELILAWFVPCSTLALLCAPNIDSTARTFSLAAVLTATSSRWSLSFSHWPEKRCSCCWQLTMIYSSIGLVLANFLHYDNMQRTHALALLRVVRLRNDFRFRAPLIPTHFKYMYCTLSNYLNSQKLSFGVK